MDRQQETLKMLRRLMSAAALAAASAATPALAADLTGAGATFPYPIYAKWADAYRKETGVGLNYQSIGSGGGIKQINARTVDFGASDMPLKPEELDKSGLLQFPTVIGGDVPVVNLKGVAPGQLKLTGEALADIYLGKVKRWNDPAIANLNPGLNLPATAISVVHRSDGSGTTFIWTNYLSKVSAEWKSKVGEGTSVNWPTGVGGKGNEGVASYVQRIAGSIGYVEYAYVKQNKMAYALVRNREGQFVAPNAEAFQAAAAGADWQKAPAMYLILTDAPGKNAWPIAGATFILMRKTQDKPQNAREVLKFFSWAYSKGDAMAEQLDYVPMPDKVVDLIQASWKRQLKDGSGKPIYAN
ncbi:MAG: phosphate ABC transporter substrate-binding protein PstS [Betaproteobacteria bacterium]|nr:MAG: phosphate ABC transporter substrate-binding protein PstS [Betaproteobacteria bacterium]